ncbi:glycosyltransferase [Gammaproteobacteria bacterium]|nr:glycosyltransferase [Gammaproteobacteria bacterium]
MKISVILPFYNEEKTIKLTIECLRNQSLIANEIIFVDSGSDDNTTKIINEAAIKHPSLNITILFSGKMSPSSSVNLGIKKSINNMIIYMDCGLDIPSNWLESQAASYDRKKIDIISGRIYTEGANVVDKCFIAHTYGFKNKCICLTGSLMNKLIFEDIGYFIENCRAGYDVDFINKVKQNSLTRSINKDVCLRYFGINFAANISDGYNKIKLYSKSGWSAYGDRKPYLYFLMLIISLLVISFSQLIYIMTLIISYIVIRGYIIPFYKSKAILDIKSGKFFGMLPVTALLFDIARINGYAEGLFKKNKSI